jgi:hypothetical protein
MQIRRDPHTVGWWTGGSVPGDGSGDTVIVGHINYNGVTGALAVLPDLHTGKIVTVAEPRHDWRYRVVALRTYPKSRGIPAAVFTRDGPAHLVPSSPAAARSTARPATTRTTSSRTPTRPDRLLGRSRVPS